MSHSEEKREKRVSEKRRGGRRENRKGMKRMEGEEREGERSMLKTLNTS